MRRALSVLSVLPYATLCPGGKRSDLSLGGRDCLKPESYNAASPEETIAFLVYKPGIG